MTRVSAPDEGQDTESVMVRVAVQVTVGVIPGTVPEVVCRMTRKATLAAILAAILMTIVEATWTATCRPIRELVQPVIGDAIPRMTRTMTFKATPSVIPG